MSNENIPQALIPQYGTLDPSQKESNFESKSIYSIGVWNPDIAHINHGSDF
jgi:hypothetical protein